MLEQALVEGQVEFDLDDPGVETCFREGWLQSELLDDGKQVALVYPTVLHAKYICISTEMCWADNVLDMPRATWPTPSPGSRASCTGALRISAPLSCNRSGERTCFSTMAVGWGRGAASDLRMPAIGMSSPARFASSLGQRGCRASGCPWGAKGLTS